MREEVTAEAPLALQVLASCLHAKGTATPHWLPVMPSYLYIVHNTIYKYVLWFAEDA